MGGDLDPPCCLAGGGRRSATTTAATCGYILALYTPIGLLQCVLLHSGPYRLRRGAEASVLLSADPSGARQLTASPCRSGRGSYKGMLRGVDWEAVRRKGRTGPVWTAGSAGQDRLAAQRAHGLAWPLAWPWHPHGEGCCRMLLSQGRGGGGGGECRGGEGSAARCGSRKDKVTTPPPTLRGHAQPWRSSRSPVPFSVDAPSGLFLSNSLTLPPILAHGIHFVYALFSA